MKELNAAPTGNAKLVAWVKEWATLCEPDALYWCDGSKAEYDRLSEEMVACGLATRLNPAKRPNCLLFRSDPSDVARVENRTFIASVKQEDAGPTNNWIDPVELKKTMTELYRGCMEGVAYEMLVNYEALAGSGIRFRKLNATGGGAKSTVWMQMKADILDLPITALKISDAGTVGSAMLTGIATGRFRDLQDAAAHMVREAETYYPREGMHEKYMQVYERYRKVYQAVRPLM